MRALRFLNVAILSVLVGGAALVYAQDDKQSDDKPARQEDPKPEPKQDEAKPPKQDEAKPTKQDKETEKQDEKRAQEQSRDQAVSDKDKQEHPDMKGNNNARPAGKGGHIPDDKFRAHFGQSHHFSARGVIVAGQPQFQYGGYTFEFVDAWPAGWAYTDDCYIDYIDGEYFLFDLLHPGVRIELFVSL